jgi:Flp pilus assembly protein TadD
VLGREHPDTLTSMSNLALVLGRQGKYEEAEAMNRQTLALKETVLGREHPDTLTSMSNLALVLGRQGKYEEAEAMNRQTLALRETVLGHARACAA